MKALENDGVKLVYVTMPPDLLNRENIRPGVQDETCAQKSRLVLDEQAPSRRDHLLDSQRSNHDYREHIGFQIRKPHVAGARI